MTQTNLRLRVDPVTAAPRKITPTGLLVATLDPIRDREAWLAERRNGIGGSEVATMLGLNPYASELDLYLEKIGEKRDDAAGEAAYWGTVLEDPIARHYAERNGVKVSRVGTIAHMDRPWQRCNLDRRIHGCPTHDRCFLEVKTRSAWKADDWTDVLPDDVEAQVAWSLAVTGMDGAHVASLIGGQRYVQYAVTPDPDLMAHLTAVGAEFWTEHVQAKVPPQISSLDLLVNYLAGMDVSPDEVLDLAGDQATEVLGLLDRRRALKVHEAEAKEVDNQLKAIAGDKAQVNVDGRRAFTYKTVKSRRFNSTRFKDEHPDTYEAYREESTSRRIDIDKTHR